MDVYGAVASVVIWGLFVHLLTNFKFNFLIEKDRDDRIAELNQKLEDSEIEVINVSNQNEVLDEKLRVALEQLRVAREVNDTRSALLNSCHTALNNFVSLFPPEHDTQG